MRQKVLLAHVAQEESIEVRCVKRPDSGKGGSSMTLGKPSRQREQQVQIQEESWCVPK